MSLPFTAPRSMRGYRSTRYGRKLNRRGAQSKETGFVDLVNASYAADTTGTLTLIATVAQGASVNQRIGKKITWKSMFIRGSCFAGSATTTVSTAFLIVYDRRPTGGNPNITDILVSANANSFNNDTNSGRFQILLRNDYQHTGNITTPATGKEAFDISEFIKLRGRKGVFKAAGTGAIGDIEEGAIYLVTVGDIAAGTGAGTFQLGFRTRFVDV